VGGLREKKQGKRGRKKNIVTGLTTGALYQHIKKTQSTALEADTIKCNEKEKYEPGYQRCGTFQCDIWGRKRRNPKNERRTRKRKGVELGRTPRQLRLSGSAVVPTSSQERKKIGWGGGVGKREGTRATRRSAWVKNNFDK